jgi:hypothetical protein
MLIHPFISECQSSENMQKSRAKSSILRTDVRSSHTALQPLSYEGKSDRIERGEEASLLLPMQREQESYGRETADWRHQHRQQ